MRFDAEQERAVRATGSAVVTAGAGSGKTTVLAERFYWLLSSRRARVEEVLTLTFTRKAAREMHERIHRRLQAAQDPLLREQLRLFDRAQIDTLDGFCAQVVRGCAERFGLAPDFRYDEEEVVELARETALDFLLEVPPDAGLERLLSVHGFEGVWLELLAGLGAAHLHLGRPRDFAAMLSGQLEHCRRELPEALGRFSRAAAELGALEPRTGTIRGNQEELRRVGALRELAAQGRYAEAERLLAGLKLRRPGGRAAPDILRMKELLSVLSESGEAIRAYAVPLADETAARAAFAVLARFQERFLEAKRRRGLVSFPDVAAMAVEALSADLPLRQHFKEKFRYVLIDEFQDNNRLQKELLYLLAERLDWAGPAVPPPQSLQPGKLFFVGDEKQSIYRFRGADVSVFKSLERELALHGGQALALRSNYRSTPALVGFYNRVFASIMAAPRRDYEARYEGMSCASADSPSRITLLYRPLREGGQEREFSAEEEEAFAVASFIRDAVRSGSLELREEGRVRTAGYGDFAILLRSTGNQIHFERMLRHLGVPYAAQNVRSLFLEAPAGDLYCLLQLALEPGDSAAYAGLLRSPFVHLSDDTLLQVLLAQRERRGEGRPFTGLESLALAPAERQKLEQGRRLYRWVRESADRMPLAELVHSLWHESGYRYFLLGAPANHNYLEHLEYLRSLAGQADRRGWTLSRFVDLLRANLGRYEKLEEMELPASGAAGVQILTVHRAKGLEFPVVILADTGNRGRGRQRRRPYTVSDRFGVVLDLGRDSAFVRQGEEEETRRELAELKRLLYVALTRARSHLVIAGSHNRRNLPPAPTLLNLLFPALGLSAGEAPPQGPHSLPGEAREDEGDLPGCLLEVRRIPPLDREEWRRQRVAPARPSRESLAPLYLERPPRERPAPRRECSVSEAAALLEQAWAPAAPGPGPAEPLGELPADRLLVEQGLENRFGTLVHLLLARALSGAPEEEPPWERLGIASELRPACLESARVLSGGFLASELGRTVLAAQRRWVELPFCYLAESAAGPLAVSGQVDLLFLKDGRYGVVDFKTDRYRLPAAHQAQLALYCLACRELTGGEVAGTLFYLRDGTAVAGAQERLWAERLRSLELPQAEGRRATWALLRAAAPS